MARLRDSNPAMSRHLPLLLIVLLLLMAAAVVLRRPHPQ